MRQTDAQWKIRGSVIDSELIHVDCCLVVVAIVLADILKPAGTKSLEDQLNNQL